MIGIKQLNKKPFIRFCGTKIKVRINLKLELKNLEKDLIKKWQTLRSSSIYNRNAFNLRH